MSVLTKSMLNLASGSAMDLEEEKKEKVLFIFFFFTTMAFLPAKEAHW